MHLPGHQAVERQPRITLPLTSLRRRRGALDGGDKQEDIKDDCSTSPRGSKGASTEHVKMRRLRSLLNRQAGQEKPLSGPEAHEPQSRPLSPSHLPLAVAAYM
ncbi:hypothetical protein CGCSCA5_v012132 [Colletotrichum siamense]|nr:hypothetical protein CGCSCA5_v012132 [Colletotrichum siamense]